MNDRKKKELLIIKFENLINRDVHKNDLSISDDIDKSVLSYRGAAKIVDNSFFSIVYNQALEQMAMIVRQCLNLKKNSNKQRINKHYSNLIQQDIQNIIAFTGRRGTGKTSAMLSFANFITDYSIYFESDQLPVKCMQLPTIDASHLGENEDILSIVLTSIIDSIDDEIENNDRSYNESDFERKKVLREKACELLKHYSDILKKERFDFESSYNYTKGISEKLDIEDDFSNFISDYIDHKMPNSSAFLVITIDDVDMAYKNHIDIMKCIHKYFMKPNIIVMITAELSFLIPEIQKTFYDNLCPIKNREKISSEQVREFLKKILPSDNRITMPSWKKKDYIQMYPINLDFGNSKSIKNFDKKFPRLFESEFRKFMSKSSSYMITPKEFILMMIANRTKIYLDVKGNKYHFMEPVSLRNMNDLFYLLYNMNNIVSEYNNREKSGNLYYLHRTENRKRLLDYIHFTMRNDMRFSSEEDDFINELLSQPIERRGKMIWDRYYTILNNEVCKRKIISSYDEDFYNDEVRRYRINYYSFGELFRILYTSTRIGIFSNNFVKFILAAFSFSLPALVENEKYEKKQDSKYAHNKMLDTFGYTLLGTWCEDLFGSIYGQIVECYIEIDLKKLRESNLDNIAITKALLYLLLLTTYSEKEGIKVDENSGTDQDEYKIKINLNLDPTAFFMNGLLINQRVDSKMFIVNYFKNQKEDNNSQKSIKELIEYIIKVKEYVKKSDKQYNFEDNFNQIIEEISENYSNCHLSNVFKHMDLIYNVIKRAVSKQIYTSSNDLTKKHYINEELKPEKIIKEFYEDIAKYLEENDEIYFSEKDHPRFSFRFRESCIYKFFEEKSDRKSNNDFGSYDEISEKGICLSLPSKTTIATDVIIKRGKKKTLGKLLYSIMPHDMYVEGEGEYMMKIRGALFMYSDIMLSNKQAGKINQAVTEPIFKFMNKINKHDVDQIALATSISKSADKSIKQIKEILNVE